MVAQKINKYIYIYMQDILLKYFNSYIEAEAMKALLNAEGIKCVLQKNGLEWAEGGGGDLGGASIYVMEKDLGTAQQIINKN